MFNLKNGVHRFARLRFLTFSLCNPINRVIQRTTVSVSINVLLASYVLSWLNSPHLFFFTLTMEEKRIIAVSGFSLLLDALFVYRDIKRHLE